MCNLYSMTKSQEAMRRLFRVKRDQTGNLPSMPGVFPDYPAPIVRVAEGERELAMARWGMPTPPERLAGRKTDSGITNVRNTHYPHWRQWLDEPPHRCVVPFTSFCEYFEEPDGKKTPTWFALGEDRPLACFAGIWTNWTAVRKLKEGEITADIFAFLTTRANAEVEPIHKKAMPVILTNDDEVETWLNAPVRDALKLQRPLPDGSLQIVARGSRSDG